MRESWAGGEEEGGEEEREEGDTRGEVGKKEGWRDARDEEKREA